MSSRGAIVDLEYLYEEGPKATVEVIRDNPKWHRMCRRARPSVVLPKITSAERLSG